jgi:hypothetical protein
MAPLFILPTSGAVDDLQVAFAVEQPASPVWK